MSRKAFWLGLDVWFVILTLVYWALVFSGFGFQFSDAHPGGWWVNLLGLFTPIGPNNLILLLANLSPVGAFFTDGLDYELVVKSVLGIALVVGVVIFGEIKLKQYQLKPALKVITNLALLLGLTLIMDLLLTGTWTSLTLLQNSLQ